MYKLDDLTKVKHVLSKRWWVVAMPCVLLIIAGIALFVLGRIQRSDSMWMITAALMGFAGVCFLFFYGVYVRPMRLYKNHVDYMLNGRKRETTGVFKEFADEVSDKDGIDCYAMLLNVGDSNNDDDDRLFYYDVHMPTPEIAIGTRVTVLSNDKMVADIAIA